MNELGRSKGAEEHIGDTGNLARRTVDLHRPLLWRPGDGVQRMSLSAFCPQKSLPPEEMGAILRGDGVPRQEMGLGRKPLTILNMFLLPVGT